MSRKRIFISSVQKEFAVERQQICEYIRQDALLGKFFEPFLFEELPAIDLSAPQAYLSEVALCDIYLLFVGQKYGFEDVQGISPTEKEFDEASNLNKYRICFVKSVNESNKRENKEIQFLSKIEGFVVRKSFNEYEELKAAIYASLVRYLEEKELLRLFPFDASHHSHTSIEDIDPDKLNMFVRKARRKRNSNLTESMSPTEILTHLDLLDSSGRVTNAAILLFGKKPQRFFISSEVKCIQFYGYRMTKPVPVYQVYRGDLFELIEQAVSFVMSRINIKLGTREHSIDVPTEYELPQSAVTEAIVNAICHRDYTSNGSVQVMLFRDRLEIWNPGNLPFGMTIEKLYQPHRSIPTNPLIALPFYLTGDIERAGTGIENMIEECEQLGLKTPKFTQDENFNVVIYRNVNENVDDTNVVDNVVDDVVGIPDNKILIFNLINDNSKISIKKISEKIGLSHRQCQRIVAELKANGIVERIGSDNSGSWKVIGKFTN